MKIYYFLKTLLFLTLFSTLLSCGSDDSGYEEVPVVVVPDPEPDPAEPESPVVLDLARVPYPTLSEYKFYDGDLKNLQPALKVLPYDLNSTLFTDYAHKKRFIWMPAGVKASYTADGKVLNFPDGTVLIKNFYYDNVQPANTTRIIETRLMIKKSTGWIFANYVWNESQTEAVLDMNGSTTNITWLEGNATKSTTYRIPSRVECFTCHKSGVDSLPIGPKPQNLNRMYDYADGSKNQLQKWIEAGYLNNNLPADIISTVDWKDTSKSLELRVRSYVDINCAHCHAEGSHCDYRPMRLAFNETANPVNLGVCVQPHEFFPGQTYIVNRGNSLRSVMYYRMKSVNEAERMPLLGRTIVHDEGLALIKEWIDSMENPCP